MSINYPVRFGKHQEYELTELALKHILVGETAVRPVTVNGVRTTEVVLSGGLHTWTGWESFLKQHADVVHLLEYDVDQHEDWFFARELQNGVITLKIPRKMFTGDAASITMKPDVHYKSGYLWKTLFPMGYSEGDVIRIIAEAFNNLDREDSTHPATENSAGVLYGYALLDDPLKAMKLRIQLRGKNIQSAFPAWEQPSTGNNGKPYSHSHSINFNIAESTVLCERYARAWGAVFDTDGFSMVRLLELTPEFILCRPRRNNKETSIEKWREMREVELMRIGPSMAANELQRVESYLYDFVCSKDPYFVQMNLYLGFIKDIRRDDRVFNAAQLLENVAECIQVLTHSDLKHGTRRAIDVMVRFLGMAVVHTGGLCSLMFKRVLGEFAEACVGHHDNNAYREFFSALASSPSRAALYTEFDLSSFVKVNDEVGLKTVGLPVVDIELKPEHLYEFIALNLGENYLLVLSKEQRLAIARAFFLSHEHKEMVADAMSFLSGVDFQFFMPSRFEPSWLTKHSPPFEEDLISITREYSRMLVMYRQRIVMEDPVAYKTDLDMKQLGSQEFFNLACQKHKRSFILIMHTAMLKEIIVYAGYVGYVKLERKVKYILERLSKEAVPMPKPIPGYIMEGRDMPRSFVGDTEAIVRAVLGSNTSAFGRKSGGGCSSKS